MLEDDIACISLTQEEIAATVKRMGERISEDYAGKDLYVVGVLKGAFVLMADLVRAISIPLEVDFIGLMSYGDDDHSSGAVRMTKDLDSDIRGRDVLIVEGIVDTGITLDFLCRILRLREPASLQICALLDKPSRRKIPIEIAYLGHAIPDHFVIGYGMDYRQNYRHLPYIGVLESESLGV